MTTARKIFRKFKVLSLGSISLFKGMWVTIKNFFSPSVTLEYPAKKQPMTVNFRGPVDFKPASCIVCYQCVKICPSAALHMKHQQVIADGKKKNELTCFSYNVELCCFCGLCDEICPTDSIFMNKTYEICSYSHNEIEHIDLMDPSKYTQLLPSYNFENEIKNNELRKKGIA